MSTNCDRSLTQLDWIRDLQAAKPTASAQQEEKEKQETANSSVDADGHQESDRNSVNSSSTRPQSAGSESSGGGSCNKNAAAARGKPPYSYATLILMAIQSSAHQKMTLNEIYHWIMENYEWYKEQPDGASWKNSIRHNLSLNKAFRKIQRSRDDPGKGSYWTIDDRSDSPIAGLDRQSPCGIGGRKRTRTANSTSYPDDRYRSNSGGPRVNPIFQHLVPEPPQTPVSVSSPTSSRIITLFGQRPATSTVQLVLPVLTTSIAADGGSTTTILQHSPVITISEQDKCYCVSTIPVIEQIANSGSSQGSARLSELCGSPTEMADLNRSANSGGSPSNLSESFRNLYKDVFNSSMSSCAGSETTSINPFLSFGVDGAQNVFFPDPAIRRQDFFSPPSSSSGGGSLENSINRQQSYPRSIIPTAAAECLQSLDMREFQGLMGSMQQKDLEDWLSHCNNTSLAASLRDFLSKSIGGRAAIAAANDSSSSTRNDNCCQNRVTAHSSMALDSTQPALGFGDLLKRRSETGLCALANFDSFGTQDMAASMSDFGNNGLAAGFATTNAATKTSLTSSFSFDSSIDVQATEFQSPTTPDILVEETEEDEFDWEQLVNKD